MHGNAEHFLKSAHTIFLVCQLSGAPVLAQRMLAEYNITAHTKAGAPGVYVNEAKIASIGLRVSNGRAYHGLALNIDMDLEPFSRINPCGYTDITVTQLNDLIEVPVTLAAVKQKFSAIIGS